MAYTHQASFKGITKSNAERQAAFKQKQRESGKQQVTFWIKKSTRAVLRELSDTSNKSEEDLLDIIILWANEKKKNSEKRKFDITSDL